MNSGVGSAVDATISDTLHASLTLAAPVVLEPPGVGVIGTPPILASGLTITGGMHIALTFPVTAGTGVSGGTVITNIAAVTSAEVTVPPVDTVSIEFSGYYLYVPLVLRNS